MKGITSGGADFDDLFDPDIVGDGPATPWLTSGGVALKYAAIAYGTKRADVGFRSSSGVDVSNLWAAKGSAQYTVPGMGKYVQAGDAALTNQSTVSASAGLSIRNDGTFMFTAGTSRGPIAISNPSGNWVIPAGSQVSDYQVWFDVIHSGVGQLTNGAPDYVDCTTSRSVSLLLPQAGAANAIEREGSLSVWVRIRRKSDGKVITNTHCTLSCYTVGYA